MNERLPLLTFHSIDGSGTPVAISPEAFVRLIEKLAGDGWRGTTLSAALRTHGEKVLGLCFDDGYRSVLTEAAPVLAAAGFQATVFVVAGRCGTDNRWPGQADWVPAMPLLDWPDLESLVAGGWEIGAHGLTHQAFPTLTPAQLTDELQGSRAILRERLGVPAEVLAYPYGRTTPTVVAAARDSFSAACGTRLGFATAATRDDPFDLPRLDAYYLRSWPAALNLAGPLGRGYLALRGVARQLRQSLNGGL
jgi:peptidoglycan/xylan/chitin deacetylase (PgdA/CDA1 family)